jgi:phosphonate transport system substrate-binding protein
MGCANEKKNIEEVDFSVFELKQENNLPIDSLDNISVAVAAMISPNETFVFYRDLFNYISVKLNKTVEFKQRQTYREVNNLLLSNQVDVAFICSGAYVEDEEGLDIIVAPLCNSQPYYQAYVVTHKDSPIGKFEDLRNKSFAYTDPISNTGCFYPEKRIQELNSNSEEFFSNIIYSRGHDLSIQLVSKRVVHAASVHSLIFNYLQKYSPEKVANLKIIEKSELFGIPPIVVSKGLDPKTKKQLQHLFLNIHNDSLGKRILKKLLIDRFVTVEDSLYNSVRLSKKLISNE